MHFIVIKIVISFASEYSRNS